VSSATSSPGQPIPHSFYQRSTEVVARELLGLHLCRRVDDALRIGRIVEVEAYLGPHDRASHSSRGLTPRTRTMFGPGGQAYVYLIYGIHHCFNVVTEPEGHGAAVLVRALEPIAQLTENASGPGLLCRALRIDRALDGHDLRHEPLWIAEPRDRPRFAIDRRRRVGVDYAGAWARRLLRFSIRDNRFVSRG
jgi:DNA-3-methyladenine glycosylase